MSKKRKLLCVPTRRGIEDITYSIMLIPWDYVEEFIDELNKQGIHPILLSDEIKPDDPREAVLDGINVCLEETVVYPLQVEE